jgi:glutamyl-tRNA reductase
VVRTCHRVEGYLMTDGETPVPVPAGGRTLRGEAAARHAVALAVGTDSVVLGEDQILHQVRQTVGAARAAGTLDATLDRLFALALNAGRRSRSWRQGPPRSLADVALDVVERDRGVLHGRAVLVVGAGEMGRLAAMAARRRGVVVRIASRSPDRAEGLAVAAGGAAARFDAPGGLEDAAGVIVALRGGWPLADGDAAALVGGHAVVVDLSAPPAVAESLRARLGARFRSIDALVGQDEPEVRPSVHRRLWGLVDATVADFLSWLDGEECRDAIRALADRTESERQAELAELWRRLPRLDPDSRAVIDGMTRHLAARILREPIQRLGEDRDGRHASAARELFRL